MFRKLSIKLSKTWAVMLSVISALIITGCSRKNYPQPTDSSQVADKDSLVNEMQRLNRIIEYRSTAVIYGTPEMMKKMAAENDSIKRRIDELDDAIRKIEKAEQKNGN
ncbi:MAG: hypothetical protein J6Q19_04115 [Bacteroidaceae bacterium]|jgi:hypothetical protein|nr:hypothetical protein [Bacteroidaceae bacterium]MBO5952299.1 hypothetical protein [Bacteroidaceae bacterium]MBQ5574382.1 hypothetical protein [Bacteroidaceae bacterium]MBR4302157.1 hypothetical protein [Bacteroidaceae bacterium]